MFQQTRLLTVTIIIFEIFMLLSRVDVVFLFWSLFPVFPCRLRILFSKQFYW